MDTDLAAAGMPAVGRFDELVAESFAGIFFMTPRLPSLFGAHAHLSAVRNLCQRMMVSEVPILATS